MKRGDRMKLAPEGLAVFAVVATGFDGGVLVMRGTGEFARVAGDRLAPWGSEPWPAGAFEWDTLPLGMQLAIEYYEAKARLWEADSLVLSHRETAGLMIVTEGLAKAARGDVGGAQLEPEVKALLREADAQRPTFKRADNGS